MGEAPPADRLDRYRGCLLGLAVGDAVGTTLEFRPRGSFEPVRDMVGGGPFGLRAGEWTDDTSMALCLAESLLERGGFDAHDQMQRYCRWWREGHLSSNGRCFDIGNTTRAALQRFLESGEPFAGSPSPHAAGNGSIMRLAPVVLYFAPDEDAATDHAALSSRTTHGAAEAVDACRLLARVILRALAGASRSAVLSAGADLAASLGPRVAGIARGEWASRSEHEIRGTGYVVECLEAALWCFATTGSYRDAILRAANLGDDADTTAAACGQIAGAFYGAAGIPPSWREQVVMGSEIASMAERLAAGPASPEG